MPAAMWRRRWICCLVRERVEGEEKRGEGEERRRDGDRRKGKQDGELG